MGRVAVEVAVQDLDGVRAAKAAGADRVELCAALGQTGGLTPSVGAIETAVEVGIGVHVLVRPRPGGFVHGPAELAVMLADVRAAARCGAHGVVVGALTRERTVDEDALRHLVDAAAGMEVTFHRAFDVVPDRLSTLQVLARLGVTRVLTSGGAPSAAAGAPALAELVIARDGTGDRIEVMAGGGVRAEHVPDLLATGVDAIHLSARTTRPDDGPSGPGGGPGGVIDVTEHRLIAAAVGAVAGVS